MNCLLILQLGPTISCRLFLLLQSPNRRPRPHAHSPRASMQHQMHPQTATVQHRRVHSPPSVLLHCDKDASLLAQEENDVPGQRYQHQFRGNHHLHSTKHMGHSKEYLVHLKMNRRWRISRARGNLGSSVCSQVSPERKMFRKTHGLTESNFILQVKINWGKQSKAFFPLPLTALNSQKASPGLSKQSLSHLLRTGNVQRPWGGLSGESCPVTHCKVTSTSSRFQRLHNTEQTLWLFPWSQRARLPLQHES